jgi:hypothetical protein
MCEGMNLLSREREQGGQLLLEFELVFATFCESK